MLGLGKTLPLSRKLGAAAYPPILNDGNTVKWFDYLLNVTKDGSNLVSPWDNKSGIPGIIAGALLQADPAKKPTLNANGVLFEGIGLSMKCAPFTLEQPEQIYIVLKQVTWTNSDRLIDGDSDNSGILIQRTTSPSVEAYAGSFSGPNTNLVLNTYGIIRVLFNGANSIYQINGAIAFKGDLGSADMNGFTLGSAAGGTVGANIEVKEAIIRKIVDTGDNNKDIYDYLAIKYGLPTLINLGVIGDSISTAGTPDWPINITSPYTANNHGVGGVSIISGMDAQTLAAANDGNDIMVLALGTNDNNSGDMGVLQAEVEENIAELKISNPRASLYYMNVLPRWTDVGGLTIVDKSNIRAAIAAACSSQGITCWDTFTVPWIVVADTADGLHPTLAGGVKIWDEIVSRI